MNRSGYKYVIWLLVACQVLFFFACKTGQSGDGQDDPVPDFILSAEGQSHTLEIATWNLKNFPSRGDSSVDWIAAIIRQMDIDIYALQEIADVAAFERLLGELPSYEGLYSTDTYAQGYQKTGLIYKRDMVTVRSRQMLFEDDEWAFPRPPLLLEIEAARDGKTFDFYLVVLHLKAYDDQESLDRRRAAAAALKDWLDARIADENEVEKDWIVAGDWNDELDDAPGENAFQVFILAPDDYRFLTMALVGNPRHASYPSRGSLIDHILISRDCFFEYRDGNCRTLRLDEQVKDYSYFVSDHRPVLALFSVFE